MTTSRANFGDLCGVDVAAIICDHDAVWKYFKRADASQAELRIFRQLPLHPGIVQLWSYDCEVQSLQLERHSGDVMRLLLSGANINGELLSSTLVEAV